MGIETAARLARSTTRDERKGQKGAENGALHVAFPEAVGWVKIVGSRTPLSLQDPADPSPLLDPCRDAWHSAMSRRFPGRGGLGIDSWVLYPRINSKRYWVLHPGLKLFGSSKR